MISVNTWIISADTWRQRLTKFVKKLELTSKEIILEFRDPNIENFEFIFKLRKLDFQWNWNQDRTPRIEEVMTKKVRHSQSIIFGILHQLQMGLSQSSQVQMKKFLNLNYIPRILVSNAINGIHKFQVKKKLRPSY